MTVFGGYKNKPHSGSIEFTSDDEMIVGELDGFVYLASCGFDGTWKRIKVGSPEALADEFFDQVKGAWLSVTDTGATLTISREAVVMEDHKGTYSMPCTMDVSKKVIAFPSPDKSVTYTARLGEDGNLAVLEDGKMFVVMRRKRWGEGMKFADDGAGASASRISERKEGASATLSKAKARMEWFLRVYAGAGGRSDARNTNMYDVYTYAFESTREDCRRNGTTYRNVYTVKTYGTYGPKLVVEYVGEHMAGYKKMLTQMTETIELYASARNHRVVLEFMERYMRSAGEYDGAVAGFAEAGVNIPLH